MGLCISKNGKKEIVGYVFDDSLIQSFAAWKREITGQYCQRCGDRHLTIDCPWIFTCPAAVDTHRIQHELMKVSASYCSASVSEKVSQLQSRVKRPLDGS